MLDSIDRIVVAVRDLPAATRDFARLLEREPEREPGPGAVARFPVDGIRLELRPLPAAEPSPREGLAELRLRLARATATTTTMATAAAAAAEAAVAAAAIDRARKSLARAGLPLALVEAAPAEADRPPAPPLGITRLDHVVLATAEPESMRDLLAETLGLRLALDRRFPDRGLRLLFFRLGGVTLEVASLLPAQTAPPQDAPAVERRPVASPSAEPGPPASAVLQGLAWRVAGLDATRERLLSADFAVSSIRPGHKPGTRVCTVRAPTHGVPTLLIEHLPRDGFGSGERAW